MIRPFRSVRPGMHADAATLTAFCRDRVAGYKLPRSYGFRTEALPQTNVSKIDKARLKREALEDAGQPA